MDCGPRASAAPSEACLIAETAARRKRGSQQSFLQDSDCTRDGTRFELVTDLLPFLSPTLYPDQFAPDPMNGLTSHDFACRL